MHFFGKIGDMYDSFCASSIFSVTCIYGVRQFASHPTMRMEDHPSAVCYLFNTLTLLVHTEFGRCPF